MCNPSDEISDQPGQPSTRIPDFVPGWFSPRIQMVDPSDRPGATVVDSTPREAVRWMGGTEFSIAFLRPDERVSPARPPQKGITIGSLAQTGHDRFNLAVPPMYWIVRDTGGELRLWHDEDFRSKWTREATEWVPWAEREPMPAFMKALRKVSPSEVVEEPGNSGIAEAYAEGLAAGTDRDLPRCTCRDPKSQAHDEQCLRGIVFRGKRDRRVKAERELLLAGTQAEKVGRSQWRGVPKRLIITAAAEAYPPAVIAYADFIVRDGRVVKNRDGVFNCRATDAEIASCKVLEPRQALIAIGEAGWRGEQPAKGTRRATILEAIKRGDVLSDTEALEFADQVESALLQAAVDDEAMDRGAGGLLDAIRKVDPEADGGKLSAGCTDAPPSIVELKERAEATVERLEGICEERWTRIGELEDQLEAVREMLDKVDAPRAPTFAQRIGMLYRELGDRIKQARYLPAPGEYAEIAKRLDRGRGFEMERIHTLLDDWGIPRNGPDDGDLDPSPEEAAAPFTLYQRVQGLADRLHREKLRIAHPAGKVPEGTKELHVVIASQDGSPHPLFVELEDQDGAGVGCFDRLPGSSPDLTHIVIPYGRDDEWVQRVAMAAIVAGQEVDRPFPADALNDLLEEFGIKKTLPRTWPHREGRPVVAEAEITDLPDEALELTENEERLYEEREEARAGESTLMEQRNAALKLLRWLIGDLVSPG